MAGERKIWRRKWSGGEFAAGRPPLDESRLLADGQLAEHGGEFISSEHRSMRALAAEFGLPLANVYGGSEPPYDDACWLDESYYTVPELNADLRPLLQVLGAARRWTPYPTLYNRYTPAGYQLDYMSCVEWISRNVAGRTTGKLGRVLLCNQLGEYGCEPAVQPALNLFSVAAATRLSGLLNVEGLTPNFFWQRR